jgi:hypothetical protein
MAKSNSEVGIRRREHWQSLLGRWQNSGLSQAEFCRRRGIPVWKFLWWKKRVGAGDEVRPVRRPRESPELISRRRAGRGVPSFVPLQVVNSPSAGECELTLRGGRVLRFSAAVDVTKLPPIVAALEALPC